MNILRNKKLLIGLFILFLVLIAIRMYPLLTQEENTLSILNGIVKLTLKDLDIYEYDSDSTFAYYLTKRKDDYKPICLLLENAGWTFKEQFGSGFLFEHSTGDLKNLTVGSTQFSRYFRLWKVPQTTN